MFTSRNEYDRGVNTFSPEGRLFQVEYAMAAVKLGSTALGIATKEGVVLAAERRILSPLMEVKSIDKMYEIDSHVGCISSGLIADARTLVENARVESQNHFFTFNEKMPITTISECISDLALDFSITGGKKKQTMSRPFGVSMLLGGVDDKGPQLICVDASSCNVQYKAAAIGSAQEAAERLFEEKFKEDMSLVQATHLCLYILRNVMEETITSENVEVAIIKTEDKQFQILGKNQIYEELSKLEPDDHVIS